MMMHVLYVVSGIVHMVGQDARNFLIFFFFFRFPVPIIGNSNIDLWKAMIVRIHADHKALSPL